MNDTIRRPGRVSEQATPISGPAFRDTPDPIFNDNKASFRDTTTTNSASEQIKDRRVKEPASPIKETIAPKFSPDIATQLDPPSRSPWSSVFWLLLACIGFWGIGSATINLVELWHHQIVLAAPLTLAGLVLVGLLVRVLRLEWRAIREVDVITKRQEAISEATARDDLVALKAALTPTLINLKIRNPSMIDQFNAATVSHANCEDYLRSFDNLVLKSLDSEAQKIVERSAITTGTAVAILPHPAFDAVLVLWRALVMTRQIGAIYGLHPTGLSAWRLLRHTLRSALLAASMDTVTTLLVDSSASALARTLKPLAEGAVIGVRFCHLGRLTMVVCRPVTASKTTDIG